MIQTINISLIPSDNKPVINVSQFDNISRVLRFNVFDDVEMTLPHVFDSTETVMLNIRKNDNNIVEITGEIITETDPETQETEQYLIFYLTEQACACVGSNYGELSITSIDDDVDFVGIIGSCNFKLIVERSPLAGGVSSQTAIDNLTTQIEQITEEVIGDNYYDKTEVDNLLDGKADVTDLPDMTNYYDKTEVDNLLDGKADVTDLPDMSDYYTKIEIDNKIINLLPTAKAIGNPANFNTSYALPLEFIKAYIVATQASGTPTPQNPLTVNGFDSVTITKADEDMQTVETVIISLGQTVYGGYITQDISGHRQLVITWAKKLLLSNDFNWRYSNTAFGYSIFYSNGNLPFVSTNITTLKWLSEIFKGTTKARNTLNDNEIGMWNVTTNSNQIAIRCDSITSLDDFINAVQNYYLYYEMPEPIIMDIADGEPLNALLGVNNISSNSGDVEVTYKCSINEAINAAISSQSNRSVSLMRSSENLETIEPIERGDNNDDNAR